MKTQHAQSKEVKSDLWGPPPHGPNPSWINNDFNDDVWSCTSHEERPHNLDFNRLPEGFRLNCKYMLWAIEYISDTRYNTRRLSSVQSYRRYFYDYSSFVKYIVSRGLKSFAEVSEQICLDFSRDNWEHETAPSLGYPLRMGTLFQKLYKLGAKGAGVIPDGLQVSVTSERVKRFIGTVKPLNETPIIPDDEARTIGNAAIDFLENTEAICYLYECAKAYMISPDHDSRHNQRSAILARENFLYRSVDIGKFQEFTEKLAPLLKIRSAGPQSEAHAYRNCAFGERLKFLSMNFMSHIMQHLIAACFINVALLNGYRSAEVMSIGPGSIRAAGVGTTVRTRIHKTAGRKAGVLTDRPGHIFMIRVDETLARAASAQGIERYWGLGGGGTLMNMVLSKVLREFGREVALVERATMTSREFRRYFAIFFLIRHNGPEDALRRAFRHVTFSAVNSYVKDAQNAKYLVNAKKRLLEKIFVGLASGGGFGALGSSPAYRSTRKYSASNLPLDEIAKDVERRLKLSSADVWPTMWGYCLLSKNDPLGAVCGGDSGIPQALEMYPGNCGRCQHLVVGRDHIPFWEQFKRTHLEARDCASTSPRLARGSAAGVRIADDVIALLRRA